MGVIDVEAPSALLAVSGADIVLLAVPVSATEATFKAIRHLITGNMLIMDVGSTKRDVVDAARRVLRDHIGSFVPCHPIAGKEVSGVEHADADLYAGKQVDPHADRAHPGHAPQARQRDVWEALGCKVLQMSPEAHDAAFAAVSHLPHLIAFALMQRHHRRSPTARISCRWPARAFATSRASPPATPRCGATCCWPTATSCWSSRKIFQRSLAAMEQADRRRQRRSAGSADRPGQPDPRATGAWARRSDARPLRR